MKASDLFKESLDSLKSNKLRTGLTVLGIIIGVASVISMISLGEGSKLSMKASIESLGTNNLLIFPGIAQPGRGLIGGSRGELDVLKKDDVKVIKELPNVVGVSPEVQRRFQIVSEIGNNLGVTVIGVAPEFFWIRNLELEQGDIFNEDHLKAYSKVAVLGNQVAKDLFGEENPLNRKIKIKNLTFKVIGVLKSKGVVGLVTYDNFVMIPYTVLQKQIAGIDYFNAITVKIDSVENLEYVKQEITSKLMDLHKVEEPDFTIFSQNDIIEALTSVISIFTIFLSFIAGISLIVGGIGIMNMMLTSVIERTKEIGLRKALGATKGDILKQILLESILITSIGGIVGILTGIALSLVVSYFFNITTFVSLKAIFLAISISVLIGVIFGIYPAKKAADLEPIVALRYE